MVSRRRSKKGKLNRVGRRRRNIRIALVVLALALVGGFGYQMREAGMLPANETAEEWYEANRRPVELVSLPADDGPHDDYTEWWYYNGHLQAQDGREYSFHFVIFSINQLAGHSVAHASLVDYQSGRHYTAQQRTAGKPGEQQHQGFDFAFGNWRLSGYDGNDRLAVDTPDFNLNLVLESQTPPVLHGRTGLYDFKQAGSSYYYSRPRMRVSGTAGVGSESQLVSGEAWFDHQWGDFRVTALAWNWFALQLDDGRDLMLFELFTPQGQKIVYFGTVSDADPATSDIVLSEEDFSIAVTERWQSGRTGIDYPMGWQVAVPDQQIDVTLAPVVKDAEFDGRQSSYLIYWEGPVRVTGSQGGQGFVELSGYQPKGG